MSGYPNKNKGICLDCKKSIHGEAKRCVPCNAKSRRLYTDDSTRLEIMERRKRWDTTRIFITKDARKKYLKSGLPKICKVCGYDKHFEVCHIKAVSKFSDEATLREMNDLNNLIPLCPNHHWEFDKGILEVLSRADVVSASAHDLRCSLVQLQGPQPI